MKLPPPSLVGTSTPPFLPYRRYPATAMELTRQVFIGFGGCSWVQKQKQQRGEREAHHGTPLPVIQHTTQAHGAGIRQSLAQDDRLSARRPRRCELPNQRGPNSRTLLSPRPRSRCRPPSLSSTSSPSLPLTIPPSQGIAAGLQESAQAQTTTTAAAAAGMKQRLTALTGTLLPSLSLARSTLDHISPACPPFLAMTLGGAAERLDAGEGER